MKNFALVLIVLSLFVAFASCGGGTEQPSGDVTPPAVDNGGNPEEVKYSQGLEFISRGEGSCSLKGIGSCTDTDILIPLTSPSGEKVTAIDASAFEGVTSILSVTIPEDVTEIGHYAFKGCTSLKEIVIPAGVKVIETGAFDGCISLESVIFEVEEKIADGETEDDAEPVVTYRGLYEIASGAFSGCISLTEVTVPVTLEKIGSSAFGAEKLTINTPISEAERPASWAEDLGVVYTIVWEYTEPEVPDESEKGGWLS
jgi:hypothetical protein